MLRLDFPLHVDRSRRDGIMPEVVGHTPLGIGTTSAEHVRPLYVPQRPTPSIQWKFLYWLQLSCHSEDVLATKGCEPSSSMSSTIYQAHRLSDIKFLYRVSRYRNPHGIAGK